MARRRRFVEDLSEYELCEDVERVGLAPLAVGFLQHKQPFVTGDVSDKLMRKLLPFCHPRNRVAALPQAMACPLCRQRVEFEIEGEMVKLGSAEIRVIGKQAIFAAPDLLPHYIEVHGYQPPQEFITAVLRGSGVDSAEFRALINALS